MKGDTIFAFFGGLIIGAAAALLLAPESGDETRRKIKGTVEREYQNLKDKYEALKDKAVATAEAAADAAQEV